MLNEEDAKSQPKEDCSAMEMDDLLVINKVEILKQPRRSNRKVPKRKMQETINEIPIFKKIKRPPPRRRPQTVKDIPYSPGINGCWTVSKPKSDSSEINNANDSLQNSPQMKIFIKNEGTGTLELPSVYVISEIPDSSMVPGLQDVFEKVLGEGIVSVNTLHVPDGYNFFDPSTEACAIETKIVDKHEEISKIKQGHDLQRKRSNVAKRKANKINKIARMPHPNLSFVPERDTIDSKPHDTTTAVPECSTSYKTELVCENENLMAIVNPPDSFQNVQSDIPIQADELTLDFIESSQKMITNIMDSVTRGETDSTKRTSEDNSNVETSSENCDISKQIKTEPVNYQEDGDNLLVEKFKSIQNTEVLNHIKTEPPELSNLDECWTGVEQEINSYHESQEFANMVDPETNDSETVQIERIEQSQPSWMEGIVLKDVRSLKDQRELVLDLSNRNGVCLIEQDPLEIRERRHRKSTKKDSKEMEDFGNNSEKIKNLVSVIHNYCFPADEYKTQIWTKRRMLGDLQRKTAINKKHIQRLRAQVTAFSSIVEVLRNCNF